MLLFQMMLFIGTARFLTFNLVFTVTFFIYHLIITPRVFRFKFAGVERVVHHSENNSIKCHEQKLCIKFAFHVSIEQEYLSKHVKIQFLGCQNVNSSIEFQYRISKRTNNL